MTHVNHITRTFIERDDDRFLVMIRNHKIGDVTTSIIILPGGVVDPGETPEMANTREVLEEIGVHLHDVKKLCLFETIKNYEHLRPGNPDFVGDQGYNYHFYTAKTKWEPVLKEPEKFTGFHWVTVVELRELLKISGAELGDGIDVALTIREIRKKHPDATVVMEHE